MYNHRKGTEMKNVKFDSPTEIKLGTLVAILEEDMNNGVQRYNFTDGAITSYDKNEVGIIILDECNGDYTIADGASRIMAMKRGNIGFNTLISYKMV